MTITAAAVPTTATTRKSVHVTLWIAQGLLAAAFLMSGGMKLFSPIAELEAQMPWVTGAMGGLVRLIGAAEVLGAIGLILPAATRIAPKLTSLAALGLLAVMVLAAATHVARGELPMIVANVALGGLAAFVAWGRTRKAPIAARS